MAEIIFLVNDFFFFSTVIRIRMKFKKKFILETERSHPPDENGSGEKAADPSGI